MPGPEPYGSPGPDAAPNRTVVLRFPWYLESLSLAAGNISQKLNLGHASVLTTERYLGCK